jgi:uncharacterized lipoprotein YehR (DUF1307 family)
MKKILSVIVAGMMILALAACGVKVEEKTVTLVGEENGAQIEFTMFAKGDLVKKIEQKMETDISAYEKTDIQMAVANVKAKYDAIPGVKYTANIGEDTLSETIIMDFTDANTAKKISEAGLMELDGEGQISLSKTIERMKGQGYTEK